MNSRIPPAGLDGGVLVAVHALDLAESAALARELPGLRALLHEDACPVRDFAREAVVAGDRDLVRRVLPDRERASGWPKATCRPGRSTAA